MKSYKVYKTIQRNPRLFGMDRNIAIEYLVVQVGSILLIFFLLGTTSFAVIGVFISIALCLFLFKMRDRQNAKSNFRKKRLNRKYPKVIKSNPIIVFESERIINRK